MDGAVSGANDQGRLDPRSLTHARWQISCAHHQEKSDQRRLTFAKDDGTTPDDGGICGASSNIDARTLVFREDTREYTTCGKVRDGDTCVVGDIAAQLEAARYFLWMVAFDSGAEREVRWAAEHEIEGLTRAERVGIPEVCSSNFVSRLDSVVRRRLARQSNAVFLRFDGDERRARQTPGRDHAD